MITLYELLLIDILQIYEYQLRFKQLKMAIYCIIRYISFFSIKLYKFLKSFSSSLNFKILEYNYQKLKSHTIVARLATIV